MPHAHEFVRPFDPGHLLNIVSTFQLFSFDKAGRFLFHTDRLFHEYTCVYNASVMTDKKRSSHSRESAQVKPGDTDHVASHHPSLTAPQLSRAISVDNHADNIIHETPHGTAPKVTPSQTLMASSESDDDENEDHLSQLRPNQSRSRRPTAANHVKRSRSQLSLESCPSDAETAAPKLPLKRFKRVVDSAVPTVSQSSPPKDSEPSSVLRPAARLSPPSGTMPSARPDKATVEKYLASRKRPSVVSRPSTLPRHHGHTNAHVPVTIPSTSPLVSPQKPSALNSATSTAVTYSTPDTLYRKMHASAPLSNSQAEPLETKSSPMALPTPFSSSGVPSIALQMPLPAKPPTQPVASSSLCEGTPDDIEVVAVRIVNKPPPTSVAPLNVLHTASFDESRTRVYSDPLLVNIAPLDISDNFGWNRFVFFVHHPRRFEFSSSAPLSELSPFSGLTLDMDHAQPSSLCAVCGAGVALRECPRCTLGFHPVCLNRSRRHRTSALCVACTSATVNNNSSQWGVTFVPPSLPPPERALPRLIADAQQGNPIDLILIPSLFNFYVSNVGNDWLRCYKCNGIRILRGGAISESVCIPFDCSKAFWDPEHLRYCSSTSAMEVEERIKIEEHLKMRARLKTSMRYFMLGEEDRTDFGFTRIPSEIDGMNFSDQLAEAQKRSLADNSITFDANDNRARPAAKEDAQIAGNHSSHLKQMSSNDSYRNAISKLNSKDLNFGRLPAANGPEISVNASLGSENRLAVMTDGRREMPNGAVSHGANSSVDPNAFVGLNQNDIIGHGEQNGDRNGIKVRLLQDIGGMNFDSAIEDALMELALAGNEHLLNLYVAFGQSPAHMKRFKRQAVLLASRVKLHPRIIRGAAGAHMPHGLVMNRGLPGTMKNGTNMVTSISLVGMAQRRIQLGASFKDFRLGQLRSELQLCSNAINQLTDTAPQNVAAVHSHTYSQIIAMREKQEDEIRAYLERLAGLRVVQHRQAGNFSRPSTQVHPQRQAETPQHTFRHLQGVATPQQEHLGLQNHHERRV